MTLQRRLALLEWARRQEAFILEDAYDSDYRYRGRPLPSLQGLDNAGQVIYMGSFSKRFYPRCDSDFSCCQANSSSRSDELAQYLMGTLQLLTRLFPQTL
jgi:GntR family transcriptional regulator/MocR family aminotransferase